MDILVLGYSSLLKNRILPIVDNLMFIKSISIAKYYLQSWDNTYQRVKKIKHVYDDYDIALNNFKGNFVYISTTNNSHFYWAKKSLQAGFHTIIDKPATLELKETVELVDLAKNNNLIVSESTVYLYHPQISLINEFIHINSLSPSLITVLFSIPPLNIDNFRYNRVLGGGAFNDMGPYIASVGRFFFNDLPIKCFYVENSFYNDVETSCSILMQYSNSRSLICHIGFTTEYINQLNILGKGFNIHLDRIFTIPDTLENSIHIHTDNKYQILKSKSGNMFEHYFNSIFKTLKSDNYTDLYNNILMDAKTRNLIKN